MQKAAVTWQCSKIAYLQFFRLLVITLPRSLLIFYSREIYRVEEVILRLKTPGQYDCLTYIATLLPVS